ncbi:MAG TPA: PIN domain-containing protein [Blastocatellia bacterium]|nr:PIN domain-containing protein [Blastocatellia bacterium]
MQSLFLDSNILLEGMRSRWGLSKAVLSLCAARIHQMVLARHVITEVERALIEVLRVEQAEEADDLLVDYFTFIDKARPMIVPLATIQEVTAATRIIHHLNHAPVLAAAIRARPDWLLSNNTEHFTQTVASRTGLKVATPYEFFRAIHP